MGKARILSAQGDGLYSIEILEDRTRAESLKQRALQRIAEIDDELAALESEWEQARLAVDAAAAAQDQAIEQHQAEILATGESSVDLQTYAQAVLEAAAARDAIRTRIAGLNLERLSRQGWVDRVDALPPLRTQQAWCADYTEDLSGEVATAEVPGEIGTVIIKPGFEDAAAWNPSADGAIQPALAGTPASVFYNLAMMPGWQKWRPTFRIATISNINEDLCDIALDPATSSQQGLNVNAQGSYSGVPIYYMDCNGAAFESGDRVLVAFSGNTDQPMVVGFEREPKECGFWRQFSRLGTPSGAGTFTWDRTSYLRDLSTERVNDCWTRNRLHGFILTPRTDYESDTLRLKTLGAYDGVMTVSPLRYWSDGDFASLIIEEATCTAENLSNSYSASGGGSTYRRDSVSACVRSPRPSCNDRSSDRERYTANSAILEIRMAEPPWMAGAASIAFTSSHQTTLSVSDAERTTCETYQETRTAAFTSDATLTLEVDGDTVMFPFGGVTSSSSSYQTDTDCMVRAVPSEAFHFRRGGVEIIAVVIQTPFAQSFLAPVEEYALCVRKTEAGWVRDDIASHAGLYEEGDPEYEGFSALLEASSPP